MWIEPAGFGQVHERGTQEQHRLKDPAKWVPFGVGAIDGTATGTQLPVLEAGADYGPGEEPRPADGLPTGTANHELL